METTTLFAQGKAKERCIFCIQEQASIIKFWRDSECFAKKFTIRLRTFLPERVDILLTSVCTMPNDTHLGKICGWKILKITRDCNC